MDALSVIIIVVLVVLIWRLIINSPAVSRLNSSLSTRGSGESLSRVAVPVASSVQVAEPARDGPDVGPLTQLADGGWLLNPKATFSLTLDNTSGETAEAFKSALEEQWSSIPYNQRCDLVELITKSNIRVREIENYIADFQPEYLSSIELQKQNSSEWASASEKDRQDLMFEFRENAVAELEIQPDCDLATLFECEPSDAKIDDALVSKYGFKASKLYVRHSTKLNKVHVVPADHRDRSTFEQLVELGLAARGHNILIENLLNTLTLKEMAGLVSDLNPPIFRRKVVATEFLVKVPDIRDRLGRRIALRELFQLQPLPPEFSSLNLEDVANTWQYAAQVAQLLTTTYWNAGWAAYNHARFVSEEYQFIKGWKIDPADICCPYCQRQASKSFRRTQRPTVPLHIGCRCTVEGVYNDGK